MTNPGTVHTNTKATSPEIEYGHERPGFHKRVLRQLRCDCVGPDDSIPSPSFQRNPLMAAASQLRNGRVDNAGASPSSAAASQNSHFRPRQTSCRLIAILTYTYCHSHAGETPVCWTHHVNKLMFGPTCGQLERERGIWSPEKIQKIEK